MRVKSDKMLLKHETRIPRSFLPVAETEPAAPDKWSGGILVPMLLQKEDVAMRPTLDFSPLFRSSIGFDRMLNALEAASRVETIDNWPPYDIVKTGEDAYRISMAVAGFAQEELTITQEQNMLVVSGQKANGEDVYYLHRGIAGRPFQRRFELADHVKVVGAELAHGLLTIDLKREVPEEMKPRRIEIATDLALPKVETKQIEGERQAA